MMKVIPSVWGGNTGKQEVAKPSALRGSGVRVNTGLLDAGSPGRVF
jgi:hypothetical protein